LTIGISLKTRRFFSAVLFRFQSPYGLPFYFLQQIGNTPARYRVPQLRIQLHEGRKHETPLPKSRVRHFQLGRLQGRFPEQQNVDIDRPRSIHHSAPASQLQFHAMNAMQQLPWK
jgi:hypothetical protein